MATGMGSGSEDDLDKDAKTTDWWGYTWSQPYKFNRVVYTTGDIVTAGGWYAENLRVQVRQHFQWKDVNGVTTAPAYPFSRQSGSHDSYTFHLPDGTWGDGIRIIGSPGGRSHFTSISQLAIYNSQR